MTDIDQEVAEEMKILTSFGGPCIYKQGVLPDGTKTGRIRYTGQSKEKLRKELAASLETGRDDVKSFVDSLGVRRFGE